MDLGNAVLHWSIDHRFHAYIGVDYSGAGRPDKPQKAIQIYEAEAALPAQRIGPNTGSHWSRAGVYEYFGIA